MRILLISSVAMILLFSFVPYALAAPPWYAGTIRANAYGIWALIRTPSVAPHLVTTDGSGQYNWVSTYGPNWIQAGWAYFHGYTIPKQYVEWCTGTCDQPGDYFVDDTFATQPWGTTVDYLIEWIVETHDLWCVYTNGIQRYCQNVRTVPTDVLAMSEIQGSPFNQLDTVFDPVYYKDAGGSWEVLAQNNFTADFPYGVEVRYSWNFRTFRTTTREIYLPLIMR